MSISKPKPLAAFSYMSKVYITTEFAMAYFAVSRRTITGWINKGMPKYNEKDLSKSNLFILQEIEEWVKNNINQTQSKNARKNTEDTIDEPEEDMEQLFERFSKVDSNDKRKMLLKNPSLIEHFNKIEDFIKKFSLNREYDTKFVLRDDVKKGQQELASMFISFLKTAMPVLSKNLKNKTQDEIYHELDQYFKKQIRHLVKYLDKEYEVVVTHYELMELIKDLIVDGKKPIDIKNKLEEI